MKHAARSPAERAEAAAADVLAALSRVKLPGGLERDPLAPVYTAAELALGRCFSPVDADKYRNLLGVFPGGVLIPEGLAALMWLLPVERARGRLAAFEDCALLRHEADRGAWQLRGSQVHFTSSLLRAQGAYADAHRLLLDRAADGLGVARRPPGGPDAGFREWWAADPEGPVGRFLLEHIPRHLREGGLEEELQWLLRSPEWLGAVLRGRGYYAMVADVARYKAAEGGGELETALEVLRAHGRLLRGPAGAGALPRLLARAREGGAAGAAEEAEAIRAERAAAAAEAGRREREAEEAAQEAEERLKGPSRGAAAVASAAVSAPKEKPQRAAAARGGAKAAARGPIAVPSSLPSQPPSPANPKSARGAGPGGGPPHASAAAAGGGGRSSFLPAKQPASPENKPWYDDGRAAAAPENGAFFEDTGGPVGSPPAQGGEAAGGEREQEAETQPAAAPRSSVPHQHPSALDVERPLTPPRHARHSSVPDGVPLEWRCAEEVEGSPEAVAAVCALEGGLVVSACPGDPALRLWLPGSSGGLVASCQSGHPPDARPSATGGEPGAPPPAATALSAVSSTAFAAGFADGSVCVFNAAAAVTLRLEGHAAAVRSVAALPSGRLATGAADGEIRLWDGAECVDILTGHHSSVEALAGLEHKSLAAPGGELLLSAAPAADIEAAAAKLWDAARGVFLADIPFDKAHGAALAALPGAPRVVAAWGERALRVFDSRTSEWGPEILGHEGPVVAVAALGALAAASASWDRTVRIWRIAESDGSAACERVLSGHADRVLALAAGPHGVGGAAGGGRRVLVSGGEDRAIRVWRGETKTSAPATPAAAAEGGGTPGGGGN